MGTRSATNKAPNHPGGARLLPKQVTELRTNVGVNGKWNGKSLFSISKIYGVGTGEIRKAIEGKPPYDDTMPGIYANPIRLVPLSNLAVPAGYESPSGQSPMGDAITQFGEALKEAIGDMVVYNKRRIPTHDEAMQIVRKWHGVNKKLRPSQGYIAQEMNTDQKMVSDITRFVGKWAYLKDVWIEEQRQKKSSEFVPIQQAVAESTEQMEKKAEAVAIHDALEVTPTKPTAPLPTLPKSSNGKEPPRLIANAVQWKWGRLSVAPHSAHLWKYVPADHYVKTPCVLGVTEKNSWQLQESSADPICPTCEKYYYNNLSRESFQPLPVNFENDPYRPQTGDIVVSKPKYVPKPRKSPLDREGMKRVDQFVLGMLTNGPVDSRMIQKKAEEVGINYHQLVRAKERLGIRHHLRFTGNGTERYGEWYLSGIEEHDEPQEQKQEQKDQQPTTPTQPQENDTMLKVEPSIHTVTVEPEKPYVPHAEKNPLVITLIQSAQAIAQGDLRAYGLYTYEQLIDIVEAERTEADKAVNHELDEVERMRKQIEDVRVALNMALEALDKQE